LAAKNLVFARGHVHEIPGCAEQVFGVVGADTKQDGFIHRASQTKHLPRQALLGKRTIENDAIGAD